MAFSRTLTSHIVTLNRNRGICYVKYTQSQSFLSTVGSHPPFYECTEGSIIYNILNNNGFVVRS